MTATISRVEVVVPARDEQQHIAACLGSLRDSAELLSAERSAVSCGVTVVLDRCTDETGKIAADFGARVLRCDAGRVGTARRIGCADAINRAATAGVDATALWIAGTDADSRVPATWLSTQIAMADTGVDAVIGTVVPADISPQLYQRWLHHHALVEGHHHVHGANLGVRAAVYLCAGGFGDAETGEDVALVQRIRAVTTRWVATHRTTVLTAGRTESRVTGGFASYLAGLAAEAT